MTRFEIHTSYDQRYRFVFSLATRLTPVILYGNLHNSIAGCRNEIRELQKCIYSVQNIAFTSNQQGYQFTIFTPEANPIAYSRFFPSQKLMKKMLSIIQRHAGNTSIPVIQNFQVVTHGA